MIEHITQEELAELRGELNELRAELEAEKAAPTSTRAQTVAAAIVADARHLVRAEEGNDVEEFNDRMRKLRAHFIDLDIAEAADAARQTKEDA